MLGIGQAEQRTMGTVARATSVDWDDLYREHAPFLRRLIERRVPRPAVEDVLQDTFLRAYRSRHRLDLSRPVRPFLATLAIRSSIQWQRSQQAKGDLRADEHVTSSFPGSDDHLTGLLQTRGVFEALAGMSPRHRRLLYLHAVGGYGCDDMASADKLSPKAVRSALTRARTNFRSNYRSLAGF